MPKETYSGTQTKVVNSPKPPTTSPSNPHWMNVAITGATKKK